MNIMEIMAPDMTRIIELANANQKYLPTVYNILGYGADPNGVKDSAPAINAAIADAAANGGGIVYIPAHRFSIQSTIYLGDGTNTTESTYHGVKLIGVGSGVGGEVNGTYRGASVLVWNGAAGGIMIKLQGPILRSGITGVLLDCNNSANTGLYCNHVAYSHFQDVFVKRWKGTAIVNTVDSTGSFAYGAASNIWMQIGTGEPQNFTANGMLVDGHDATSLDVCRNVFIGLDIVYGGSTGAYGIKLRFCDNNSFYQTFTYRILGSDSGGRGILFQQATNPAFPQNNAFYQCAPDSIGGTSGTNKNIFLPLSDDGQGYSSMLIDNVIYHTYDGRVYEGMGRRRSLRQVQNAYNETTQTTNLTTFSTITGTSRTLLTLASKVRITFNAYCGKNLAGSGKFALNFDGLIYNATICEVPANGYNLRVGFDIILDVGAVSHPIKVDFVSTDTNTFSIFNWSLIVEELD